MATVPQSPALGTPRTRLRLGKKEKAQQRKHEDQPTPVALAKSSFGGRVPRVPATASARRPLPAYSLSSPATAAQTCPVLFSKDSVVCFVASGSAVKVYATHSCELLSTLSVPASERGSRQRSLVSALILNPANALQLVVASLDGTLRVWDYTEGVLVRTLDVGAPVLHACASSAMPDHIFVALATSSTENRTEIADAATTMQEQRKRRRPTLEHQHSQHDLGLASPSTSTAVDDMNQFQDSIRSRRAGIYSVSLRPSATTAPQSTNASSSAQDDEAASSTATTPRAPARRMRLAQPRTIVALTISASGEHLISLSPTSINVCRTKTLQKGFTTQVDSADVLTTIAVHPNENYFATGNARGQIKLWYDVLGDDAAHAPKAPSGTRPATATFHWHAHAVAALAFTPSGAYLMSGGEEAVLVMWQLHTGHHEFVPRLGAPILALSITDNSVTEQQIAARLRDGSVVFVGSQKLRISKTISGLKADPVRSDDIARRSDVHLPLAFDPLTRSLVLSAGHPSSLQFYSPADDAQTLELEVAPSNRVSAASDVPLEPTRVEYAVFSPSSASRSTSWLATLDSWSNQTFESSRQLKFWQRRSGSATSFALTTRIDRPHDAAVTSMTFSPAHEMPLLLTTSVDGRIKLWSFDGHIWACRTSLMYRAMTPVDSAWSADGSMFAVAHESVVTLWSTHDNKLIHAFACAGVAPLSRVVFAGQEGTLLLAGGQHGTMAWDLMTFTETHTLSLEVGVLAPRPRTNQVVAIEKRKSGKSALRQSTAFVIDPSATSKTQAPPTYELPLQVRQAIWFDPLASGSGAGAGSLPSPSKDDSVSLAVVDDAGNISLVGSSVASVGRAVAPSRLPTAKKAGQSRLFDEIFGADEPNRPVKPVALDKKNYSVGQTRDGSKVSGSSVLDMPAHSLPPPRMLWRKLFSEYQVTSSSSSTTTRDGLSAGTRVQVDGEQTMNVDEVETNESKPVVQYTTTSPTDALTDIFKTKFLLSSPTKRAAVLGKAPKA
ncbi:NET1-associated nuclear protein 1 [Microbotryomycetes sp. JL201]|nr:NET1-associated nuclear protein 1 [Microbotryomycetes sp. JL201]